MRRLAPIAVLAAVLAGCAGGDGKVAGAGAGPLN